MADELRGSAGGRSALVVVAQAEIRSGIDESESAMYSGGGLLFALVDASVNPSRAKEAEAAIQSSREALTGFDFDALAKDMIAGALADIPWFQAQATSSGIRCWGSTGISAAAARPSIGRHPTRN